jgi:hypothetical protein
MSGWVEIHQHPQAMKTKAPLPCRTIGEHNFTKGDEKVNSSPQ